MKIKEKPELLAPCGSPQALDAAIAAGADAVYAGGVKFNARMSAHNFDDDAVFKAIEKCHANGVRFYLTLNTAIYDRELSDALSLALTLYKAGADALIITDLGLVSLIREYIPDLELHASTQLSGHNSQAAKFLSEKGFARMVCARELSFENIKKLNDNSPIETEMFIHGAHCVSASGQCLMSSLIGGRSGNRGECAQPCRMQYNGSYPLSLKDMCLAGHIEEILDLGVSSLKIEGRLKSPSYVYGVTSVYRRLIDERRNASENEIKKLAELFSRGGFTDGYFTGSINKSMLGVRSDADKAKTRRVSGSGDAPRVKAKPLSEEKLEAARQYRISDRARADFDCSIPKKISLMGIKDQTSLIRSARFLSAQQISGRAREYFDICYLPLDSYDSIANGVVIPAVITDSEYDAVKDKLKAAFDAGARHALCGNVGHIALAREIGFTVYGDFRLNIMNGASALVFSEFEDIILSPELILPQIRDIKAKKCVITYGRLPVMHLEKRCGASALRDRKGAEFPVVREGSRESVLNSVPVWMADRGAQLGAAGIGREHFIFTTESAREVDGVISAYQKKLPPKGDIRRIKQTNG